jgi:hypothetical protein
MLPLNVWLETTTALVLVVYVPGPVMLLVTVFPAHFRVIGYGPVKPWHPPAGADDTRGRLQFIASQRSMQDSAMQSAHGALEQPCSHHACHSAISGPLAPNTGSVAGAGTLGIEAIALACSALLPPQRLYLPLGG